MIVNTDLNSFCFGDYRSEVLMENMYRFLTTFTELMVNSFLTLYNSLFNKLFHPIYN